MKAILLMAGTALSLAACTEDNAVGHKSSPAERACYDALANTHAYPEEIEFVRTRAYDEDSYVTLRDSRGLWNCNATNDGYVTELEPG
jgi:hypothetical protein